MKKKILSVLLAVCLIVGALPMAASAASNPYPTTQDWDGDGNYEIPCTYFAWQQAYDNLGIALPNWGFSGNWLTGAQNASYATGSTPKPNSIAVWSSHVAFVTSVSGSSFTVNEGGRTDLDGPGGTHGIDYGFTRYVNDPYIGQVKGFIYLKGGSSTPSAKITLDDPWIDNISNNNATIHSVIRNNGVRVSAFGLEVVEKKTKKNIVDHWENLPSNLQTGNYINVWVDIKNELGVSFTPGTEYECFFFIDVGGKIFSKTSTFKTTGNPPVQKPTKATISISKTKFAVGEKVTFTCTANQQSKFFITIKYNDAGLHTQQYIPASYTTSFTDASEYTAYVTAINDAGQVDSPKISFSVTRKSTSDPSNGTAGPEPTPEPTLPTQFIDVPVGAYYADAVKWAVENGITAGTDKTHFSPNASCTRAQAVTFLWNSAGKPEPQGGANPFTDVKSGSYYEKAVQWAVENNITGGTGKNTFSPNATCTRAQIVTFLYRAENSPETTGNVSFSDVPSGAYYKNAVKWAVENGITSGTGGNQFSPGNNCVRSQIVTFLYRYSK